MKLNYVVFDTCLGWMGVSSSRIGLVQVVLPQDSRDKVMQLLGVNHIKGRPLSNIVEGREDKHLDDLASRLKRFLGGEFVGLLDKLDLTQASFFQRWVWEAARSIAYGNTRTYTWIARKLGMPNAARAVGQALARNPLPIIIPCHRVVCSSGALGGFSAGIDWKRRLLDIEASSYDKLTSTPLFGG